MERIHKLGRVSLVVMLFLVVGVPLITSFSYGIFPPAKAFFSGLLQAIMIYLPISAAEFLSFVPILGPGGSYLAFVTGNLTNLKIPAAVVAMEQAGVKQGSEEAQIIAMISVAVSSMVTIVILLLGMLLIIPLSPLLKSPVLKPAFDQILPALFGALGAHFFMRYPKLAPVPLGLSVLLAALVIYGMKLDFNRVQGVLIPLLGAISVLSALAFYKKGWIKKEDL